MSRLPPAGLLLLLLAGCTNEPAASTPAAAPSSQSPAEWPVKPASHEQGDLAQQRSLDAASAAEQAFDAEIGKLAVAALQLEGVQDYESSQEARREILEKLERRYGNKSWQAVSGRVALRHSQRLAELTFEERGKLLEIGEAERWSAAHSAQGRRREALTEATRAVELTREVWGDDYYLTANRQFDQAQIHHALGEDDEAEALYRQVLAWRGKALGRAHPDYVAALNALAVHQQTLRQYEPAEKLLLEALALDKEIWGEDHPTYAVQLNNLGMLYHTQGENTRAAQMLEKSAEIRRRALGETHSLYAHSLYNLGSVHYAARQFDQAGPAIEKALPIFEAELGSNHQMTILAKNNLAMVELAQGNLPRAQSLLDDVCQAVKDQSGKDSADYAAALAQLAVVYSHQLDYERANKLLTQAQAIQEETLGGNHPALRQTLRTRAEVLRRINRISEAESLEEWGRQLSSGGK